MSLRNITIIVLTWVVFSCWLFVSPYAFALDDFDLAKYGSDDKIEVKRTEFIVKLVLYTSDEELNKSYEKVTETTLGEGEGVRGFASVHSLEDVCYVHIMAAKIWDDREAMAIMGHEVYHCALSQHETIVGVSTEKPIEEGTEEQEIESLYDEDRKLELEWLSEDYEKMGIVITEDK